MYRKPAETVSAIVKKQSRARPFLRISSQRVQFALKLSLIFLVTTRFEFTVFFFPPFNFHLRNEPKQMRKTMMRLFEEQFSKPISSILWYFADGTYSHSDVHHQSWVVMLCSESSDSCVLAHLAEKIFLYTPPFILSGTFMLTQRELSTIAITTDFKTHRGLKFLILMACDSWWFKTKIQHFLTDTPPRLSMINIRALKMLNKT